MTVQFSTAVRNAMLDAIETAIGVGAIIKIKTGAPPADCATADSGTVLWTATLAADWAAAAAAGSKAWSSTPITANAAASGAAGHYRVYAADGTTCHQQGTVTVTGGGGDLTVDNITFTSGLPFSITSFSQTAPGA